MLLASLAMIPVAAGIKWIIDRSQIDWKTSGIVAVSLATLWYAGVSTSTFIELRRSDARRVNLQKSFPATTFAAGIYGLCVLMATATGIGMYREGDPLWLQFIDGGFYALAFYGWPRTIHCDESGVWQRSRFCVKTVIPYDEIISVTPGDKSVVVTGDHATIEHSLYHADADEFLRVVSRAANRARVS
jgi:hypothetical protein